MILLTGILARRALNNKPGLSGVACSQGQIGQAALMLAETYPYDLLRLRTG